MPQMSKVGKYNTKIYDEENFKVIQLYRTQVVKFNEQEIILNSGGWKTSTTKNRMNQASNQFDLEFGISQHKGEWYVQFNDMIIPFKDNMVLRRTLAQADSRGNLI